MRGSPPPSLADLAHGAGPAGAIVLSRELAPAGALDPGDQGLQPADAEVSPLVEEELSWGGGGYLGRVYPGEEHCSRANARHSLPEHFGRPPLVRFQHIGLGPVNIDESTLK